jgi:hypothetical protein
LKKSVGGDGVGLGVQGLELGIDPVELFVVLCRICVDLGVPPPAVGDGKESLGMLMLPFHW